MDLKSFSDKVEISTKKEIKRIQLVAYYMYKSSSVTSFNLKEVLRNLEDIGEPILNTSRIKKSISESKIFKKSKKDYMIMPKIRKELDIEYGVFFNDNNVIESSSELLPEDFFCGKRWYLDSLIKQINNCYKNNCYDACAVLLRRVFEICLIHSFENHKIENEIKDSGNGNYFMLEKIIEKAKVNKTLNLSRSKNKYNDIRNLGNFAAHKITYNTPKGCIDTIKLEYDAVLQELYDKAGLLK